MRLTPKQKLEALLLEAGFQVDYFMISEGYYRIHSKLVETLTWEAYAYPIKTESYVSREQREKERVRFVSFSTMTDCARRGITIAPDDETHGRYWVNANA